MKCIDCPEFKLCSSKPKNYTRHIRSCCWRAVRSNIQVTPGDKVLEVGYGHFKGLRKRITKSKAFWYGVEPRWQDKTQYTFKSIVSNMPFFKNDMFDYAVSIDSIEHWNESRDSIPKGISEMHRVLKPNGKIIITTAAYCHGADMFLLGEMDKIRALFDDDLWKDVNIEEWRKDYEPLSRRKGWRPKDAKAILKVCPTASTYTISITAYKR